MEVMDRRVEVEEVVTAAVVVAAAAAEQLLQSAVPISSSVENGVNGVHEKCVYFDKNDGLNASTSRSQEASQEIQRIDINDKIDIYEDEDEDEDEEEEEEEIELEFERAVDKVHTHTPYCPSCSSQITKVILRRRTPPNVSTRRAINVFGYYAPLLHGSGHPHKTVAPHGDVVIDISCEPVSSDVGVSASLEILKCIVYGGLMELIASLSVVSSAAASDATTLNIICIGLATMVSGLILFGHNLYDMKNEVPQENSGQQTDRYEELLGRRGNFLLHSSLAILSFLVFGLTPPLVYGFTFHESDNKHYKILAVAVASFTCILILAAAKAYVKQAHRVSSYITTVMYYVTLAVSVSGVAYAAGDLFKVLMERIGWFEP